MSLRPEPKGRAKYFFFCKAFLLDTIALEVIMKNKIHISHQVVLTKEPPKAEISEAEFRLRLTKIDEWRKKRLAENPR